MATLATLAPPAIVLPNFPLRNQLNEATQDGKPDENAGENCVPTSIGAAIKDLTGAIVYGDTLKDLAYGQGYVGGGSAARYVPVAAKYGVNLSARAGSQAQLIGIIREELRAGHPCLITMPSAWNTPPRNPLKPGLSHVGCVYAIDESDSGFMTVMNPWRGFADRRPIATWRKLLCYGQVWPLSRLDGKPASGGTIGATAMQIPAGWHDDGATLTAPNGVVVVHGFRDYVLAHGWDAADVPLRAEAGDPTGSFQPFAAHTLEWTPAGNATVSAAGPLQRAYLAGQSIPDRYVKALAAIEALAAAVAADTAA